MSNYNKGNKQPPYSIMSTADTSKLSHYQNENEGFYTGLQDQIISILNSQKEATRRILCEVMNKEQNSLCAAIKDLENRGVICYRKDKCDTTKRLVRFYSLKPEPSTEGEQIELF